MTPISGRNIDLRAMISLCCRVLSSLSLKAIDDIKRSRAPFKHRVINFYHMADNLFVIKCF